MAPLSRLRRSPPAADGPSRAVAQRQRGEAEAALVTLTEAADAHSNSAIAHFNLGSVLAELERYQEAADALITGLSLEPNNAEARLTLAKAYIRLHQYSKALEHAGHPRSLADNQQGFDAHHVRGVALRRLGALDRAEPELRRALVIKPDHADANYQLGFVLARKGEFEQAGVLLEKAKELDPASPDIRFQLARVLKRLGESGPAKRELDEFQAMRDRAQRQNRSNLKIQLANQALREGNPRKAMELYQEALGQEPDNAKTYYNLSVAHSRLGQSAERRRALETAIELDPSHAEARHQMGLIYLAENNVKVAEEQLLFAIEADPGLAEAHSNLGVLYGRVGKGNLAEQSFRKAVEARPDYTQARLNLGLMLAGQGNLTAAKTQIAEALRIAPDHSAARTAMAMVLTRMGRSNDAVPHFRQVVAAQPGSAEAHLNLGIALAETFELESALEEFTEAARLAPHAAAARYSKGRVLSDLGRAAEAKQELEAAIKMNPRYTQALYLLATIEQQDKNLERSATLLQKVISLDPKDRNAHFDLGQNLNRLGRNREAVDHWKRLQVDGSHRCRGQRLVGHADAETIRPSHRQWHSLPHESGRRDERRESLPRRKRRPRPISESPLVHGRHPRTCRRAGSSNVTHRQ